MDSAGPASDVTGLVRPLAHGSVPEAQVRVSLESETKGRGVYCRFFVHLGSGSLLEPKRQVSLRDPTPPS